MKKGENPCETKARSSRRLSGDIATLILPKTDNVTEGDWQTVTTEHIYEPPRVFSETLAKETGSSLVDVSYGSEYDFCQFHNGSAEKIIQHPQQSGQHGAYHLRWDKKTNRRILVPNFRGDELSDSLQNSSHRDPRSPSRAAAAMRRFSSTFHRTYSIDRPSANRRSLEMKTLGHSYETLSSENPSDFGFEERAQTYLHNKSPFRRSCAQQNPERGPPKAQLSVFDQPIHSPGILEDAGTQLLSHVSNEKLPSEISRLPFPLISLPEAAKLQHFRRERGEEDHSITGGSFMAKTRSRTISTVSSLQCPRTPLFPYFDSQTRSPPRSLPVLAPIHQRSRMTDSRRTTACKFSCIWAAEDGADRFQ